MPSDSMFKAVVIKYIYLVSINKLMLMKPFGSLYQFIQPPLNIQLTKNRITTSCNSNSNSNQSIYLTNSKPKLKLPQKRSRIKTTLQNYQASSKKHLKMIPLESDISQNFLEADTWRHLMEKYRMTRYREPANAVLLPKKTQIIQLQAKNKLNIDHGLLRALEKIRLDEQKIITPKGQHEESFSRYSETLSKLKLVPLENLSSRRSVDEQNSSQVYKIKKSRDNKILSDTKRIEFERNLSWAKKHHKNGNYYEMKLGKIKVKEDWGKQVRKRKNMLSVLGEKYLNLHEDRRHSVN